MYFDGSKRLTGLGAVVVRVSPTSETMKYMVQIMYTDSNNAVEYQVLPHGLQMEVSMGIQ